MAKETKFARIRDYLTEHPEAPAEDVIEALGDAEITSNQVYQVRHQMKKAEWDDATIDRAHLVQLAKLRKEIGEHGIQRLLATLRELDP